MNEKYGIWTSNGIKFDNSYDAYLNASNYGGNVTFSYNHDIFSNFNTKNLGNYSLNSLYRERAQQLRDTYDYLILYYSGGADSHNVLCTFLNNNIKLDEVCIKWPKILREGKLYKPNIVDKSAKNYWSEWDFAIKPTLDWLTTYKPEIKITFQDFIGDPNTLDINKMFEETSHHAFLAAILLNNSQVSDSEIVMLSQGKTVGNIYGVDKPLLSLYKNKVYMFFTDNALRTCVKSKINPYGAECFYWSPDMPILPFAQAYYTSLYYSINREARKFLYGRQQDTGTITLSEKIHVQNEIANKCVYSTWDNRFQAKKPSSEAKLDKFFWFFEHPELNKAKEVFMDNLNQRLSSIKSEFLTTEKTKDSVSFSSIKILSTQGYFVNEILL